jgi:ribonuclease P protein component
VSDAARPAFPKASRLLRRAEFLAVQRGGRRVHTPHFLITLLPMRPPSSPPPPGPPVRRRFGFTVTKKVAKQAVRRNRVKRVLREVCRRHPELFPLDTDVVIIAKQGAPEVGYAQALEELSAARSALRRPPGRGRRRELRKPR